MLNYIRLLKRARDRYRSFVHGAASLLLVTTLGAATGSCALVLSGTSSNVPLDSDPQGAEVFVDGVPVGATPLTVKLSSRDDHVIVFKRAGHQDQTVMVERRLEGGYLALDIMFTALIGVVIDAATGAWWEARPEHLDVILPQAAEETQQ